MLHAREHLCMHIGVRVFSQGPNAPMFGAQRLVGPLGFFGNEYPLQGFLLIALGQSTVPSAVVVESKTATPTDVVSSAGPLHASAARRERVGLHEDCCALLLSARDRVFLWPVGPTLVRKEPLVTAGFRLGDIDIPRGGSRGAPWTS